MKLGLLSVLALANAGFFFDDEPRSKRVLGHLQNAASEVISAASVVQEHAFDNWSLEDVKEWLEYHKIEAGDSMKETLAAATEHRQLLMEDLHEYIIDVQKDAAKVLQKGQDFFDDKGELIEDQMGAAQEAIQAQFEEATRQLKARAEEGRLAAGNAAENVAKKAENVKTKAKKHVEEGHKAAKDAAASFASDVDAGASSAASDATEIIAEATEAATDAGNKVYEQTSAEFVSLWSDSKIKEFLDARGIKVPQNSNRDSLMALVARAKHASPINSNGPAGRFWFDGWSRKDLSDALTKVGQSVEGTREELSNRLFTVYSDAKDQSAEAFAQGQEAGADASKSVLETIVGWKEAAFDSWSTEDLKEYVSSFGDSATDSKDSLVAKAQENYRYFVYGETKPQTFLEKVQAQANAYLTCFKGKLNTFYVNYVNKSEL